MNWRDAVTDEWHRRHPGVESVDGFPLMEGTFTANEILAAVETILSGQLTMHDRVRDFEKRFAAYVGAPFAVMVNSGSSANLLAVGAAVNTTRKRHLRAGDEVLIPAVCWSTSVWPFVQAGLVPVFVDVDPATLNISLDDLRARLTPRTRAIMVVHVLGNACDMRAIADFAALHDLVVIEDTCESLGALTDGAFTGTAGDFGTYSFYYSHHMTTGEGGMIVCRSAEDDDLLRCLRAHGWSRSLSNRTEVEAAHPDIDPRFLFVNVGYNVRPLDIQAAIGDVQLSRLPDMNHARNENRARILDGLRSHALWRGQFRPAQPDRGADPAWFGLAMLLEGDRPLRPFLDRLTAAGVENRPAISGNFARQPALRRLGFDVNPESLPGAETVHRRGFFIGIHSTVLPQGRVDDLATRLLSA